MITRFYLPRLSTNVKHPKFECHVASLCQGLRRSAGSGGEDPENQVGKMTDLFSACQILGKEKLGYKTYSEFAMCCASKSYEYQHIIGN